MSVLQTGLQGIGTRGVIAGVRDQKELIKAALFVKRGQTHLLLASSARLSSFGSV